MARSTQEMTTALRVAGENLQRNLRADSASLFEWAEMAGLSDSEQSARLTVVTESFRANADRIETRLAGADDLAPLDSILSEALDQLRKDTATVRSFVDLTETDEAREALESLLTWIGKHAEWIEIAMTQAENCS